MDKEQVIKGIKERLYSTCELKPSEVLVLKEYIEELENKAEEYELHEFDDFCIEFQDYCRNHHIKWEYEKDYVLVEKDSIRKMIPYIDLMETELEIGEVIESYLGME